MEINIKRGFLKFGSDGLAQFVQNDNGNVMITDYTGEKNSYYLAGIDSGTNVTGGKTTQSEAGFLGRKYAVMNTGAHRDEPANPKTPSTEREYAMDFIMERKTSIPLG